MNVTARATAPHLSLGGWVAFPFLPSLPNTPGAKLTRTLWDGPEL